MKVLATETPVGQDQGQDPRTVASLFSLGWSKLRTGRRRKRRWDQGPHHESHCHFVGCGLIPSRGSRSLQGLNRGMI